MKTNKIIEALHAYQPRSAWDKGVKQYALDLLDNYTEQYVNEPLTEKALLNGARNWEQYSNGRCALWANEDIANRLFSPSVANRRRDCDNLQIQARALRQAWELIKQYINY